MNYSYWAPMPLAKCGCALYDRKVLSGLVHFQQQALIPPEIIEIMQMEEFQESHSETELSSTVSSECFYEYDRTCESEKAGGHQEVFGRSSPPVSSSWIPKSKMSPPKSPNSDDMDEEEGAVPMKTILERRLSTIKVETTGAPIKTDHLDISMSSLIDAPPVESSPCLKEGYLLKLSSGLIQEWQQRYFCLHQDSLVYYGSERDAKQSKEKGNGCNSSMGVCGAVAGDQVKCRSFPLVSAGVQHGSQWKGSKYQPNRFILYTPSRVLLCETTSPSEALAWTDAIQAQISHSITEESSKKQRSPANLLDRVWSVQGNDRCADCGGPEAADWFSVGFGVTLCIGCAGRHRSLGTHQSRVRSLVLDDWNGPLDLARLEIIFRLGNRIINSILLGNEERRVVDVHQKYISRTCQKQDHQSETVFKAVLQDDLPGTARLLLTSYRPASEYISGANGYTLLHTAATAGHTVMAVFLAERGCSPQAKDDLGRTPIQLALDSGYTNLASLLGKYSV